MLYGYACAACPFLQEIHALLTAEQRQRLAYLIRTGVLTV